jgi:hypothetical protein
MAGSERKGRARAWWTRPVVLQARDVRRLQALGAARDFELNRLAFAQRFVTLRHDGGKVDENVLAGLALDESKAFAGVKPLHCSLFFQLISLFCLSYLVPSHRLQRKKKGLQVWTRSPSTNLKVSQEQQTQTKYRTFARRCRVKSW